MEASRWGRIEEEEEEEEAMGEYKVFGGYTNFRSEVDVQIYQVCLVKHVHPFSLVCACV